MNKHTLKGWVRTAYSCVVWHSGLWRVFDALMPRRLVILAGHCVGDGRGLPPDMTLSPARLRAIVAALDKGFAWSTVGEGLAAIERGGPGRSLAALSFDDGYRDNHDVLLPILEECGARATVFLEGRPLLERKVSWSHQYFWLIHMAGMDARTIARELIVSPEPELPRKELEEACTEAAQAEYRVKRVLKYECAVPPRNRALQRLFETHGGEESALCEALYMTPAMAQHLHRAGVELGGHTYSHEVLASLPESAAAEDVAQGRAAMAQVLGPDLSLSFAYPYGRRWDFRPSDGVAAQQAGYAAAVTTHPGVFTGSQNRFAIGRVMVAEDTPIHHILCEACGAFEWLRRLGIELAE